jgi:hypothetical protein
MNSKQWFAAHVSLLLIAGVVVAHARQEQKASDKAAMHGPTDGAWRLVSYKYRDADLTEVPKDQRNHQKYITGGRFIWIDINPNTKEIQSAAGGKYVLDGKTMKETPEFGLGADSVAMRGIEQTFTVKLEGDTLRQSGTLKFGGANPENMKLEEVWERIK